jgi:hypothetical protein
MYLEPYTHYHQQHFHPHFQYQHENQSLSPHQSSTSDVEETSPSLNRAVCILKKRIL